MELKLLNLGENYLFVYRILTEDNVEILRGNMYTEKIYS